MTREILIVEDEGLIAGLLRKNLSQKGYEIAVLEPRVVLRQVREHKPSLVILDTSASDSEAWDMCGHLRETTSAPIVALAESPTTLDEMEGVTYLSKPPDFRELLEVVEQSLHLRKRKKRIARFLRLGELTLDLQTHRLNMGENQYRLTPKEFRLLEMFMSKPGQVLNHKAIMKEVWDTSYVGDTRTLYVHVSWIRRKIEENPRKPLVLRTVRGIGYRIEVEP